MGRPTNKSKFIKSIFNEIEQSTDMELQTVYICLLKEKLDAINNDYKTLLYDEIYSILDGLFDIMIKLHIEDNDHTFVIENIKAVLNQKYWTMYMNTILKENIIYGSNIHDQ